MASSPCLYNFETVGNFRRIPLTNMYRSARPDKVSEGEVDKFVELKIQSIYDLRSLREYPSASGLKLADDVYQPTLVKPSLDRPKAFQLVKIDKTGANLPGNSFHRDTESTREEKIHFVFDLISERYIRCVIHLLPLRYRLIVYFLGFLQRIFGGGFFQKILVQLVINYKGLLGQYKCMIDFCGKEICAVLYLMSEPQNVPGVICCSHGKDRTGIVSALLMSLTGADKHTIAEEYNKSEGVNRATKEDMMSYMKRHGIHSSFSEAKYNTMISLIEYIEEKYGSVPGYLCIIGFDMEDQKRLLGNISSTVKA